MSAIPSKRFWIFSGSIAGIIVLLAILIAANVILGALHWRTDLTEDKIFTLSEGTRNVMKKLDGPVTIKLFFSQRSPDVPIPFKNFARQVADLVKEYQLASGGKIIVETYDPQPDSDAEEWAERYGLAGQNMGLIGAGGETLYLGLVAVKGDANASIPFIDPRTEELLEYNITRLISRVANPRKPVVGVMSSLPVMGVQSFPYAMPGQPPPINRPPWVVFQNLAEDYDIRQIPMDTDKIDADIDALIVVHPKNMTDPTQFAIDQFILRGGRLLAFVDPLCITDAATQTQANMMDSRAPKPSSDLGQLPAAWGIIYEPDKILVDLEASTRVRQGENAVDDSPVFLSLRTKNIDGKDVITANLESLILPCAGVFTGAGANGLSVGSLLVSSAQSELINPMMAQMSAEALRRNFKPGLKRLNLAIRLQGKFKTAFPAGKPKAEPKPADKDAEKEPEKTDAAGEILKESAKPTSVILVGDVDLLYDQFAVQELNLFGSRVFQPMNDNLNFFLNALEQLAGSADLAGIRSRGRFERPFDRVQALQREAQQRWLLEERALQEKLDSTRQRLEALQSKKDNSQRYILSPEQEQEINSFKQEQIKTQRDLKQVRKNLREGIERLGVIVKTINVLLIPALVIIAGVAFGLYRRRRTRH
ncbi:MAG: Gldg family protein [Verrucomicrobia bacterium]|nr:Gldg family protein [Verrucomicrobiota bacterium]MBU4247410.1 Gldg family protein [Verrucomicrobiota bacterium]MBU4290948.1 Gldg family protein [Verrucomicrobiota bacterium]MBU4497793.1 Gldg family protein [Verrucomicrobiota bacterium]MCG2681670.1 Gldg family protein [Kiritimatiellia bacterium]